MILFEELTEKILKAAYQVHNELGCGFMEKVYQEALAIQMHEMNILFEREKHLSVQYHGKQLQCDYIADFVVDNKVIVELKAVTQMDHVFQAQVINYLKITGHKIGFLINFGQEKLEFIWGTERRGWRGGEGKMGLDGECQGVMVVYGE